MDTVLKASKIEEKMFYYTHPINVKKSFFIHAFCPYNPNNSAFLFLSPILDEKKRVHRFENDTARALCNEGYYVFRFDYYGLEDSHGELFEFDIASSLDDLEFILSYIKKKYLFKELHLLGTRIGADLCVLFALNNKAINNLYLIEPIVKGSRFLMEQRLRRKAFQKLNSMINVSEFVTIDHDTYEDYQGYLLSNSVLKYIENIATDRVPIINRNVFLFKLNNILSVKFFKSIVNELKDSNNLVLEEINCSDFWTNLENTDTSLLTNAILKLVKN